jgi:hypothetical protein
MTTLAFIKLSCNREFLEVAVSKEVGKEKLVALGSM